MNFKYLTLIIMLISLVIVPVCSAANVDNLYDSSSGVNTYLNSSYQSDEVSLNHGASGLKTGLDDVSLSDSLSSDNLNSTFNKYNNEITSSSKFESSDKYSNSDDYYDFKLDLTFKEFNTELSDNNTIFVNSSYTGSSELGTVANPFKSINAGYNRIVTSDKNNLFLAEGIYNVNDVIKVNKKSLNIIGQSQNVIISGNNKYELFLINNTNINLNFINLTIANGLDIGGGAIYINKTRVNFINVIFRNNKVTVNDTTFVAGGVIANEGGTLNLYNTSFINNSASGKGLSSGSAIYNSMGTVNIFQSDFINNTVRGNSSFGGVISDYAGFLKIINSSFLNNQILSDYLSMGGAVSTWSSRSVYILNSVFDRTSIYGNYTIGSVISNQAGLLQIVNSTVSNNYADGKSFNDSTITNLNGQYKVINLTSKNNTADNSNFTEIIGIRDPFTCSQGFTSTDLNINLPSKYDLRNINGTSYVTSVKNQGNSGSCWSFATFAALESYLLKTENITYDFSENNLKNMLNNYASEGFDYDEGGNQFMSLAYLLRWNGPVNESQDPFSDLSYSSSLIEPTKYVQDVLFVPLRFDYTDNNQIKLALMKYGALYISIYGTGLGYYNSYYLNSPEVANHAVAIVGWDDNYSADNFRGNKPPADGAFIIKNSWGRSNGDNGYVYVSYYDEAIAGYGIDSMSAIAFTGVENTSAYKDIYQYDTLGNTLTAIGYGSNTAWFMNQFTSKANSPLKAFGIYTYGSSDYLVNITVNGVSKYIGEGSLIGGGYHTIKLSDYVPLKEGDIFRIAVKLTTNNTLFPVAVETNIRGYSSKADASSNESFISPDGINWYDISQDTDVLSFMQIGTNVTYKKTNVCLKAYTDYLGDLALNLSSNISVIRNGELFELVLNLKNNGDLMRNININCLFDNNIQIKSLNGITKGIFDQSRNNWYISSLNNNETAVLKLGFVSNTDKTINNIFKVNTESNNLKGNFTVDNILSSKILTEFTDVSDITEFAGSIEIPVYLVDMTNQPIPNKTVYLKLNDSSDIINSTTDNNGHTVFKIDLNTGNYTYYLSFEGDDGYESANAVFNININKKSAPNLFVNNTSINYNSDLSVLIMDENNTGLSNKTIQFIVNDNNLTYIYYNISDENGTAHLYELNTGNYTVNIIFDNDITYSNTSINVNITVNRNNGKNSIVFIKHTGNDKLDIQTAINSAEPGDTINLGTYNYTDISDIKIDKDLTIIGGNISGTNKSQAIFIIENPENISRIIINSTEFNVFDNNTILELNGLNTSSNLIQIPAVTIENNTIKTSDESVNPNTVIILKLNSETTILAPTNPIAIKNNNITDGINQFIFNVNSINTNDGVYVPRDGISGAKSLTHIVYSNMTQTAVDFDHDERGNYFVVKLVDDAGRALEGKFIQIGFNGVVYNRTTNETGEVSLQINLANAGKYTFAIAFLSDDEYNGSFVVAKIQINKKTANLKVPNKTFRASQKTKTLTISLTGVKSTDSKATVPGIHKTVRVTVNGKTYTVRTNSKGQASINIKISKKGTYTVVTKFAGDGTFNSKTTKTKITVN